ncbi:TPA: iron-sulfur cluster biosynthesis family protein [Bacillus cereus]
MYVTVTEAAYKKIMDTIPSEAKYIKLFYDNEGWGCVMSGIIDLVAVAEKDERDVDIESSTMNFIADRTKLVFMDDKLTVDWHEGGGTFQLKSPSQFYNPNMKLHVRV